MIIKFILPQNIKRSIMLDTLDNDLEQLALIEKYQYLEQLALIEKYQCVNYLNTMDNQAACRVIKPPFNVLVSYRMDNLNDPNYWIPKQMIIKDTKAKRIVTFIF